jgi:hypothetical protein
MSYIEKTYTQKRNTSFIKIPPITKEQFYPNTYPKELMYSMMNEFGSLIRNTQYKKSECRNIAKTIKRARTLAFFPYCSAHFFKMK